jgi:hypothetical protein
LPFQSKVGNEQLPGIERFARVVKEKGAAARISKESADTGIVGGPPEIHLD